MRKIIRDYKTLELQNVRSAGLYTFTVTCQATNKGGSATANATIEILGEFVITLIRNIGKSYVSLIF